VSSLAVFYFVYYSCFTLGSFTYSYGVVKIVRMRFESPFHHPLYRLLLSCWTNVTGFKISLLFPIRIMGSEMSLVSLRLCHQEMDNLQDNIHVMTELYSQALRRLMTSFDVCWIMHHCDN